MSLQVPAAATAVSSFHGFHIHANDDPANGDGCQADPAAEPSEWFVSADGHLKQEGQLHGDHDGDMAPLFLDSNGSAEATFTIEGSVDELDSRVVIVHAGPDNLGNVPVGSSAQPVQPQQSRRSGPHPGHRKCWRPGRLRRDHRWMTRSEGQHLLVRRSPTPLDTPQRVPEGASREPPRRRLERHRSPPTRRRCSPRSHSLASDMSHREPVRDVWIAILEGGSTSTFISSARLNRTERDSPTCHADGGDSTLHRYRPATARPNTSTEPLAQARRRRCRTACACRLRGVSRGSISASGCGLLFVTLGRVEFGEPLRDDGKKAFGLVEPREVSAIAQLDELRTGDARGDAARLRWGGKNVVATDEHECRHGDRLEAVDSTPPGQNLEGRGPWRHG